MTLCLFIFYEMTLGRKSYWYPYLRLMPEVQFTSSWTDDEMVLTQDDKLVHRLQDYNLEVEVEWHSFYLVLQQYPDIFKKHLIDKGLFLNVYAQICTRCFGQGLVTTSMVPMGDNLNHSCVDITIELINQRKQLEAEKDESYFKISKFFNDYSALYPLQQQIAENENLLNIKGRFDRTRFEEHCKILGVDNIRQQLTQNKSIWEIFAKVDKYTEDNDSNQESEEESDQEIEGTHNKQASTLEELFKELNLTDKEKARFKNRSIELHIKLEQQAIRKQRLAEKDKKKKLGHGSEAINYVRKVYEDDLLRREFIVSGYDPESKLTQIQQKWVNKGVDDEEEENYEWVTEMLKPDQADVKMDRYTKEQIEIFDKTYLTFINEMREPMPKGSQAWYCYGNRTNSYLLINYGFCFPDNLYNSYKIQVRMKVKYREEIMVKELLTYSDEGPDINQIRLKIDQLNMPLVAYLRQIKKEYFFGTENQQKINEVQYSKVTDLAFELSCLKTYSMIIRHLIENSEAKSSYEGDKELLTNDSYSKSWNERMAVLYRSERKKILHSQYIIVAWVIKVVTVAIKLQNDFSKGLTTEKKTLMAYQDLYLTRMESESVQTE